MDAVGCVCTSAQQNKVKRVKNGQTGAWRAVGRHVMHDKKRTKQPRMVAVAREDHGDNNGKTWGAW